MQDMRLRDYFVGKSFCLHSLLSPRTVAERINTAAKFAFWPFNMDVVVGGVWAGYVRLQFKSSPFEYNAKPVLAGQLREGRAGSILTLRYRAPAWIYLFEVLWYGFLALTALGLVFGEVNPDLTSGDWAAVAGIYAALLIAPFALHYFGTRNADDELTYILDFLAEHADARPQTLL